MRSLGLQILVLGEESDAAAKQAARAFAAVEADLTRRAALRLAVPKALAQIGDPRAVEPLVTALKVEYPTLRAGAAGALGQIGDPRAIEPLVATLQDPEEAVRDASTKALELLGWKP